MLTELDSLKGNRMNEELVKEVTPVDPEGYEKLQRALTTLTGQDSCKTPQPKAEAAKEG